MKKFDCFTYFNEAEILLIRLHELSCFMDYFVIVEANKTFTGTKKPFLLDEILPLIDPAISKKIIRVKIEFASKYMTSWEREIYQRNQIEVGLAAADPEDMIIISDVDEIPNTETLGDIDLSTLPVQLDVTQFFWNLHWQAPDHCNQGARPVVARKKDLDNNTPQELRAEVLDRVPNGGWHFSFFGEGDKAAEKIRAFAHTEYDKEEYTDAEKILCRIEKGIDPFDRFPLKYREIDNTYPNTLQ